jgi:hypothetical protein
MGVVPRFCVVDDAGNCPDAGDGGSLDGGVQGTIIPDGG